MFIDFMASVSWATNPLDKQITTGIYSISRQPMDFGGFVATVGTGITCASWVLPLFAMIGIIFADRGAIVEEHWCLEKYGDAYREYIDRTPRWIGILKSRKND